MEDRYELEVRPAQIRDLRTAWGKSQPAAARRLGKSTRAFRLWEDDRRESAGIDWANWAALRAEVAKDLFGVESWPPPSYEEIMEEVERGTERHEVLGVPLIRGR